MADLPSAATEQMISASGWRKSTWSLGDGECVEVAVAADRITVRDTKSRNMEALHFSAANWHCFIEDLRSL
jgi:Domain of unknown function (DUF397)